MSPDSTVSTRPYIRWYLSFLLSNAGACVLIQNKQIHDRGYAVTQAELDMSMDDFLGLAHNGQIEYGFSLGRVRVKNGD